jgi:hypothetical protein
MKSVLFVVINKVKSNLSCLQGKNHQDEAEELMIALQEDGEWSTLSQVMKQDKKTTLKYG